MFHPVECCQGQPRKAGFNRVNVELCGVLVGTAPYPFNSKTPRPERPEALPCQQVAGKACLRVSAWVCG